MGCLLRTDVSKVNDRQILSAGSALIAIMHATANDERIARNHQHRSKHNEVFHLTPFHAMFRRVRRNRSPSFGIRCANFVAKRNCRRFGTSAGYLCLGLPFRVPMAFPNDEQIKRSCGSRGDRDYVVHGFPLWENVEDSSVARLPPFWLLLSANCAAVR
jgi:hypothetical protein